MRTRTLVAIWSLPAWYTALNDQAATFMNGGPPLSLGQMLPPLAEWYLWVPLTPLVLHLTARYPIAPRLSRKTVLVHAAAILGIALARGLVYASTSIIFSHASVSFPSYLWRTTVFYVPFAIAIYGVIAFVDRTVRLQQQLARAEMVALRASLRPHFLFNALHTVAALVRARDHDAAVEVIAELGDLLREQLARDGPDEVRLRDEIAFVRRYLAIEQVRFRDRLRVHWDVAPGTIEAVVPRLLLQPLAENAIRHGIGKSSTAGQVRITTARDGDWLLLTVTDDGPGPEPNQHGAGQGLATARARLQHIYGPEAGVTLVRAAAGGAVAAARLPFRHA